jgi:hypothetical protein
MDANGLGDDDYYTLLGVRADGVASVVDLLLAREGAPVQRYARRLLAEHASCEHVEIWRGAALLERLDRADA